MKPSELYFCLNNGDNNYHEEDKGTTIITFCPVAYWNENKCLPDYFFSDQMIDPPDGYDAMLCVEETQWLSFRSVHDIRAELTSLGFVESVEMEQFLAGLWE